MQGGGLIPARNNRNGFVAVDAENTLWSQPVISNTARLKGVAALVIWPEFDTATVGHQGRVLNTIAGQA